MPGISSWMAPVQHHSGRMLAYLFKGRAVTERICAAFLLDVNSGLSIWYKAHLHQVELIKVLLQQSQHGRFCFHSCSYFSSSVCYLHSGPWQAFVGFCCTVSEWTDVALTIVPKWGQWNNKSLVTCGSNLCFQGTWTLLLLPYCRAWNKKNIKKESEKSLLSAAVKQKELFYGKKISPLCIQRMLIRFVAKETF